MFGIGTVARLAQVSVRTLRYYDEVGLLRPRWVDPATGYRWYTPEQLHRLHRIVALKDLGMRLTDIVRLLDEDPSPEELRGILLLRRAEAHDRFSAEAERLARVEARLKQLEETPMSNYDVVVKTVEPVWVLALREELSGDEAIGPAHARLWPRLHERLDELGLEFTPPSIATEVGRAPISFIAALPVPEDVEQHSDGFDTMELSGLARAAATVIYGNPDFHEAFGVLHQWVSEAGETPTGEAREVYLDCDGPRETWVVELQLALAPRD